MSDIHAFPKYLLKILIKGEKHRKFYSLPEAAEILDSGFYNVKIGSMS